MADTYYRYIGPLTGKPYLDDGRLLILSRHEKIVSSITFEEIERCMFTDLDGTRGWYIPPHLVEEVVSDDGNTL